MDLNAAYAEAQRCATTEQRTYYVHRYAGGYTSSMFATPADGGELVGSVPAQKQPARPVVAETGARA